jgi:hypothetical protein
VKDGAERATVALTHALSAGTPAIDSNRQYRRISKLNNVDGASAHCGVAAGTRSFETHFLIAIGFNEAASVPGFWKLVIAERRHSAAMTAAASKQSASLSASRASCSLSTVARRRMHKNTSAPAAMRRPSLGKRRTR